MLKFRIEQIAINPPSPEMAERLLADMGAVDWAKDHVTANGEVFEKMGRNEADLAFNYDIFNSEKGEFEILHYTDGPNWLNTDASPYFKRACSVSHLGMHCTAEELLQWRSFFSARGIGVAQEVFTEQHTNPTIAGKRWYNYVIFNTKKILGVDLKFIVRMSEPKKVNHEE